MGVGPGGRFIGLSVDGSELFSIVEWRSGKIPRVTHSSFDAETIEAVLGTDMATGVGELVSEALHGVRPGISERRELETEGTPWTDVITESEVHTDSKCLVDRTANLGISSAIQPRRRRDIADMKECVDYGQLRPLVHIAGPTNPVDGLTKEKTRHGVRQTLEIMRKLLTTGIYLADRT